MGISKIGPNQFFIKARVIIPNPDPRLPRDDRRRQEVFHGSKPQAEDRLLALKAEMRGEKRVGEAKSFRDVLKLYEDMRGVIPRGQRTVYDSLVEDLGALPLKGLDASLKQYSTLLRKMPSKRTGKRLANGTINRYRAVVATAIGLAVDLKTLPESPLNKAVWPKLKEIPRDRILSPEEEQRLRNVLEREAPHLVPLYQFATLVPCRKSELVRMTKADLDLFNEAIRVNNGTTKNDEGTWKPLPPVMVPYFRSLPPECPYLFYRLVKGGFRPLGDFKKSWGRCLKLAGIHNLRFHDSRRISASGMVNAGTSERDVMKVAGWKTNMLSTYWGSLSQSHLDRVKFPGSGSGNSVATSEKVGEKGGEFGEERAVS